MPPSSSLELFYQSRQTADILVFPGAIIYPFRFDLQPDSAYFFILGTISRTWTDAYHISIQTGLFSR